MNLPCCPRCHQDALAANLPLCEFCGAPMPIVDAPADSSDAPDILPDLGDLLDF